MLKLFKPFVSWRAVWAAIRVLRSGQLAEGPEVKKFEEEFAAYHGLDRCLAVNSGTSALELAAHLLDLKPYDEVIVPVLTCAATATPFARRGCRIVLADIDSDLNVSVDDVSRRITPRTKALVFVRFGGNDRGLTEMRALADRHGIPLIDDAAQAIGARNLGVADFAAVSLQATKTVTSVDGGFLICRSDAHHERAKRLRWFGFDREVKQRLGDAQLEEAGFKFHMNDLAAAIGRANLRCLPKLLAHREKLAAVYRAAGLFAHPWLAGSFTGDYAGLKARAGAAGIEIGQHHYPLDGYHAFDYLLSENATKENVIERPIMRALEGRYYFVPYGHHVSVRQAKRIAKALR
jgi:perosamine synthetase